MMMKRILHALVFAALVLGSATPAVAQSVYPTPQGRITVPATVPLQCNASAAQCVPITAANPQPVSVQGAPTVAGTVASGATDSGNPVKVGGVNRTTLPTLTDGQRGDLQLATDGSFRALTVGYGATPADGNSNASLEVGPTVVGAANIRRWGMLPYVFNGTTWDRQRGDVNGLTVQPGLSTTFWYYASGATPILSNTTTAVTIKTAAGASVRNYIDACQLTTTAFGASVPLALRDGAGGTVRFALTVPTAGFLQPVLINFSPPLQGTANTLWEVVTTTANTTGTVTLNCQGHTGA